MLVLDASAAVAIALSERGFGLTRGRTLAAPPLLFSEAVSSLHAMAWRGEISAALAETALARVLVAPVRRDRPRRLHREAWRIATERGWAKTYDAEYLALALLLGCPLLTIDARLRRGAAGIVPILGPADL